jgi:hypothetical protein
MNTSDDTLRKPFQTWDWDIAVSAITSPASVYCKDDTLRPEAVFHNNSSTQALDFWAVLESRDSLDQLVYSDSIQVFGLTAGIDTTVYFNLIDPPQQPGLSHVTVSASLPLDANASNNSLTQDFTCILNNFLVYEQIPDSTFYNTALINLGMPGLLTNTWDDFFARLISKKWDLVLVNSYSSDAGTEYLDSLNSYQANGGSLILFHWNVSEDPTNALWTNMGISYDNSDNPDNFFPDSSYASHQIYRYPNAVDSLIWTDDQWGSEIQLVDTLPGARKLGHFQNWADPYNSSIVLNAAGNCIFNAFESDNYHGDMDGDGKIDVVELLENEIVWILPPHIVHTSPDSGSSSVAVTDSLVIGFSEPIDTANFSIACSPDPGSWVANWNAAFDTVTLAHADFDYSAEYMATVTAKDLAGKDLKPGGVPNPFVFTTGPNGVTGNPNGSAMKFFLSGAYPNPVKGGQTVISFGLPKESQTRLEIYNIMGQKVSTLVSGKLSAGIHNISWNGCDHNGNKVASGVFIYRMISDCGNATRKLVVLR